ncbi:hypothetical protein [Dactylosporangium sp. CA-092794]|uniref:hypothetical protein n=1 Tax=Dactylosporangium sp. CA-092794 TaxID=3239929 RepID=UPI003D8CD932
MASFLAVLSAVGVIAFAGKPAQADDWYQQCYDPGLGTVAYCVEYTGGYPSGYARAQIPGYYGVKLRQCTSAGCRPGAVYGDPVYWSDVTAAYAGPDGNPVYTASVRVGKFSAYQACAQQSPGAIWNCPPERWSVYLGD